MRSELTQRAWFCYILYSLPVLLTTTLITEIINIPHPYMNSKEKSKNYNILQNSSTFYFKFYHSSQIL